MIPHLSEFGMNYYTPEEVLTGTETKVKELMRTVLEGEQVRAQDDRAEDPASRVSEVPVSIRKRKLKSFLNFGGGRTGGGETVMSLFKESNVTTDPEAADNVRMDETVCEQSMFTSEQRARR